MHPFETTPTNTQQKKPSPKKEKAHKIEKPLKGLLNAFLRKLSCLSGALTSFELRIRLTDNVKSAFTLYHLTIFVAALH